MLSDAELAELDPRDLIAEAYRIDGISGAECRSVFLDWAIGLEGDTNASVKRLSAHYAALAPLHPMTDVLREGDLTAQKARRRGGRRRTQAR